MDNAELYVNRVQWRWWRFALSECSCSSYCYYYYTVSQKNLEHFCF